MSDPRVAPARQSIIDAERAEDENPTRTDRCEHCRFVHRYGNTWDGDVRIYAWQCRLRGPGVVTAVATRYGSASPGETVWPHVARGDWCGEFQRRES